MSKSCKVRQPTDSKGPYNAVQVELEEGVRLTGNVVGVANDALRVGLPVEVVYDDVTQEVTLPRFKPR